MRKSEPSIHRLFLRHMIAVALVSVGLVSALWIQSDYSAFQRQAAALRETHLENQKKLLTRRVLNAVGYIDYMRGESERRLRETIRSRVYEAHAIASNIYRQYEHTLTPSGVQAAVNEALRPIRFNSGRGYYFAVSMDGVEQLYPVRPEFEGKNVIDLQDSRGNFVIKNEIDIIKSAGEGFVIDYWPKPGRDPSMAFEKISFVKYFEPFDWYLGAGEYIDDADAQIRQEVMNRLVDITYVPEGYLFCSTFDGRPLFANGRLVEDADTLWNLTDPEGVRVVQAQREAVEKAEGGFVYYHELKPLSQTPVKKISFVKAIGEWGWILGASAFLDAFEQEIENNRAALWQNFKMKVFRSVAILVVLLVVIVVWATRISDKTRAGIEFFSGFFQRAATAAVAIKRDELHFKEFERIAEQANRMIEERAAVENALRVSEEKFKKISSSAIDAIIELDPQGNIVFWNDAAETIFGYSSHEVYGKNFHELAAPQRYLTDYRKGFSRFTTTGKGAAIGKTLVLTALKKGGEEFEIELSLASFEKQGAWHAVGIVRDISERRKAEQEREKLIADLRAAMAEIRTLTGMLPICSHCKKIRDDKGYWGQIEAYIQRHSDAEFSHSICPDCAAKLYPDFDLYTDS